MYQSFIATLSFLRAPKLFDNTPPEELGEQNFLANILKDTLREALDDLDENVKLQLQAYVEQVFSSGLNATLNTIATSHAQLIIDEVDLAKDRLLYASRTMH